MRVQGLHLPVLLKRQHDIWMSLTLRQLTDYQIGTHLLQLYEEFEYETEDSWLLFLELYV